MLQVILVFAALVFSCQGNAVSVPPHGFVSVEKGKLFYRTFGKGEPVLMVHGGPGYLDHVYFIPQMLELAKDYQLIFYDQRGCGRSLQTTMEPDYFTTRQFVEDMESLRKNLGLDSFILLGHSWGGYLALHYALVYPEHVKKLVLLNTLSPFAEGQKAFQEEFAKRVHPIQDKVSAFFQYDTFAKLTSHEISLLYETLLSVYVMKPGDAKKLNLACDVAAMQQGYRAMVMLQSTLSDNSIQSSKLRELKMPVLVLHGDKDIIPAHTAQDIANAIPSTCYINIKNCGHLPYIEQPEAFFKNIRKFLHK